MLADLAHEMRTPLATVDAHLEAIEDGVRNMDADTLRVIRASTRRLRRLAEDIAAVSRAEEGSLDISPQAVQAAALARAAAESARDRFDAKGVHLSTHLDTGEPVLVDPERIGAGAGQPARQRPAAHPGRWHGHPVLSTAGALGAVRGRRHRRGHQRRASGRVFDRFYRVDTARDRNRGGSGIGLSIAKALVEAHGGDITVTSPGPGRGSTFTVRLPVADQP